MPGLNQLVNRCVERWRTDLRELTAGMSRDPVASKRGRSWERDFNGEINNADIQYAVFIAVLSFIPAAVAAYTSSATEVIRIATFFRAPLQVAISGFLTSVLVFAFSHLIGVPRPFSVAFKTMLRIMSIHPVLALLTVWRFGEPIGLLILRRLRGSGHAQDLRRSAHERALLFGPIYLMFAMMQLSNIINPNQQEDLMKSLQPPTSFAPQSRPTICTSSSSVMPS